MPNFMDEIINIVSSWEGVTAAAHRFGGREFNVGKVEIGHIHRNGMVDIPYTKRIREQLIAEGKTEPHHILPETGWTSFYIRQDEDTQQAIWLFKLSYIHKSLARNRDSADLVNMLDEIGVSEELRKLVVRA
jgi:Family of unknown function (DUF5519)